jgi:hypothetical protein
MRSSMLATGCASDQLHVVVVHQHERHEAAHHAERWDNAVD